MRYLVILLGFVSLIGRASAQGESPWRPPPPPWNNNADWVAGYAEGVDEAMQGRFHNDNSGERALGYIAGHQTGSRLKAGHYQPWDGQFRQPDSTDYVAGYVEGVNEGMENRWHNDNSGVRAFGYTDGYVVSKRIQRGEAPYWLLPEINSSDWTAGFNEGVDEAMSRGWHNDNSGQRGLGYISGFLRGSQIKNATHFYPGDGDPTNLGSTDYTAGWTEGVGEALTRGWHNDNSGERAKGYIDGYVMGMRIKAGQFFHGDGQIRLPGNSDYTAGYTEGYNEGQANNWHNDNSGIRAVGYVDGWLAAALSRTGGPRAPERQANFQTLHAE